MESPTYFAKRVSWADSKDDELESQYLIGGRTREGHLKGGGTGNTKSKGFVAFATHLSFLGILVISALLISSFVNSIHHYAFEILSIVGIVVSCVTCVSALLSLCGLYSFDAHSTRLLLMGHLLCWACLLMQVAFGGLIIAYWGTSALPDVLKTSPDQPKAPVFVSVDEHDLQPHHTTSSPSLLAIKSTTHSTKSHSKHHSTNSHSKATTNNHHSTTTTPTEAKLTTASSSILERLSSTQAVITRVLKSALLGQSDEADQLAQSQSAQDRSDHARASASASASASVSTSENTDKISPASGGDSATYVSRTMMGILTISAVVALSWCVMGISAVGWPSGTQLHVIRINLTLCALALFAIGATIETLGIYTLVHPPTALGIAYDDVSSWSVYGASVSALFVVVLSFLLFRLLFVVGKEQELNVLHTRLSRRSAATSSTSTMGPSATTSRAGGVGIVSTRTEHSAVRYQRTLSSLHTVMFVIIPVTAAIITFSIYTYNLALSSVDELAKSQLLLTSSILGFTSPVFNFVTWVTCYQWHRRILDSNDSDIYSKHSHVYEPVL